MYERCFDCGRNYLFEPKAKKHLPFFSYTAKHKKQFFPFFPKLFVLYRTKYKRQFSFFLFAEAATYAMMMVILHMPGWMFMNANVMMYSDVQMNVQTHIRSHNHNRYFLRNNHISALTFRCKPPLGASSPFTSAESALTFRCKPPLGASSPFTFGGISVDFSL